MLKRRSREQGYLSGHFRDGLLVEPLFKDSEEIPAAFRAKVQRPLCGGIEPRIAETLREIEETERGTVALLRVLLAFQDLPDERGHGPANLGGARDELVRIEPLPEAVIGRHVYFER